MRPFLRLLPVALLPALLLACGEPCPTGQSRCDGACVDTQVSAAHCGACGQGCGLGTCAGGVCSCDGAAGTTDCAGYWPQCVDLTSEVSSCGTCGHACAATNGVCLDSTCCVSGQLTC